jgi:uroporphyrinogen decarboxylase
MRAALRCAALDRLPTQVNYTAAMGRQMAAHFGVSLQDLPVLLDNHLLRVDLDFPGRLSDDGSVRFDWWGAGHATAEEGYFIKFSPLQETKDLDGYSWPDPRASGLMDNARRTIAADGEESFVIPNLGFALFERAWSLRGFEQFLMDLALDPGFAADLLDRITAIQLVLIQRYLELGVDGAYFGDDYGAQQGLIMSPQTWRQLFKPRLDQLFAPFRLHGLPVIMHSDGQIQQILPDLVEIGLTALNPVQPEVLDHAWLRESFSGRLTFYGGVSTQTVLPYGSPEEVRQAVAACRRELAPYGTGLILAPSHRLLTDIPLENVAALLQAFRVNPRPGFSFSKPVEQTLGSSKT